MQPISKLIDFLVSISYVVFLILMISISLEPSWIDNGKNYYGKLLLKYSCELRDINAYFFPLAALGLGTILIGIFSFRSFQQAKEKESTFTHEWEQISVFKNTSDLEYRLNCLLFNLQESSLLGIMFPHFEDYFTLEKDIYFYEY